MVDKLGVFICSCGPNLGEKIAVTDLAAFARTLPEVTAVQTHGLLCSAEGQALMGRVIREAGLDKVVVAGCSPQEHETTFRTALEKAGLNGFQLQMANIREQCVWVTPDPEEAAQKARALLRAAVWRVREHTPIFTKDTDANTDVLVVGGGVAGLAAALHLANQGRRVHLVDRAPFLGGKTVLYEKVFPGLECGACLVSPWIDRVLHEETIQVHLNSEIRQAKGYFGNFEIGLRRRARGVDPEKCLGCGACQGVCPARTTNEHFLGLADRPAIYLPFPGAQPAVAVLDRDRCLRHQGGTCQKCLEVCPRQAVLLDEGDRHIEIKVGAIVLATGFEGPGRKTSPERGNQAPFLSGLETEILLNSVGPTGGRLPWPEGSEAGEVGIIAFEGWDEEPDGFPQLSPLPGPYLKLACQIRDQLPRAAITFFYQELNLPDGEALAFFRESSRQAGLILERLDPQEPLRVSPSGTRYRVEYSDRSGIRRTPEFDLLIAAEKWSGSSGAPELAELLRLPLDGRGFWKTLGARLEPVNTPVEGVYAAGAGRGPRDVAGAVLDGQAAAGQILSRLIPGQRLSLEPLTARVEAEHCSGCRVCLESCPFLALEWQPDKSVARVNELLCRGCGLCAALCPSGAIGAGHYEDRQIRAEIKGLLHAGNP